MRKALWSSAALVVLLSGAVAAWESGAQAATSTVTMGSDAEPNAFKFFPAEITVPAGTTIRWQNKSDIPHDATAEDGSFKSEQLPKGGTFEHTFATPGDFPYICTVQGHKEAGMKGVVKVTGAAGGPPTAVASTTATTAAVATTTTTAAASSTTTTTSKAVAGGPTTTTTAGIGVTSTTQAASTTPTSAPESAGVTTTTAAAGPPADGAESAATDHASEGGSEKKHEKSSPLGIAFAGISTVLLLGISGKLLTSKP